MKKVAIMSILCVSLLVGDAAAGCRGLLARAITVPARLVTAPVRVVRQVHVNHVSQQARPVADSGGCSYCNSR